LNEQPVIQINSISNFLARSKYWGSRYGVGDYGAGTRAVLVEANHQRWWCPVYTDASAFISGMGAPNTGAIIRCGVWRCATFVAWVFASVGYTQLTHIVKLPVNVFNSFPYANNEIYSARPETKPPALSNVDELFSSLSANKLNNMPYEEFVMVADIPLDQATPTHIATEWQFANNDDVTNIKRGIFIDRLAMSNEPDIIPKFLKMYEETKIPEIKTKLIQGLMIYYQNHTNEVNNSSDFETLKKFYSSNLYKKLPETQRDMIVRGYIDFHTPEEILKNVNQINMQLNNVHPRLVLGLQLTLAHKSAELESIYIPSAIALLTKQNNTDLDDMFFGLTKMGYKTLRNPQSISQIKSYLKLVSGKYLSVNIANDKDPYAASAKESYIQLQQAL